MRQREVRDDDRILFVRLTAIAALRQKLPFADPDHVGAEHHDLLPQQVISDAIDSIDTSGDGCHHTQKGSPENRFR